MPLQTKSAVFGGIPTGGYAYLYPRRDNSAKNMANAMDDPNRGEPPEGMTGVDSPEGKGALEASRNLEGKYNIYEAPNHAVFIPAKEGQREASDSEYSQFEKIAGDHPIAQDRYTDTGANIYSGHKADSISGGHFLQGSNVKQASDFKDAMAKATAEMDTHKKVDSPPTGKANVGKGIVSSQAKAIAGGECCIFNPYGRGVPSSSFLNYSGLSVTSNGISEK